MVRSSLLVAQYVTLQIVQRQEISLPIAQNRGDRPGYTASHLQGNRQLTPLGVLLVCHASAVGRI